MKRAEIGDFIEEITFGEGLTVFDGLEDAFLGVAVRFEPISEITVNSELETLETRVKGGTHRYFAVYSYDRIIEGHMRDGMTYEDAVEYHSFNTEGAYVGEDTPAILYEVRP